MSAKMIDDELAVSYNDVLLDVTAWSCPICSFSQEKYSNEPYFLFNSVEHLSAFWNLSLVDFTCKKTTCSESSIRNVNAVREKGVFLYTDGVQV